MEHLRTDRLRRGLATGLVLVALVAGSAVMAASPAAAVEPAAVSGPARTDVEPPATAPPLAPTAHPLGSVEALPIIPNTATAAPPSPSTATPTGPATTAAPDAATDAARTGTITGVVRGTDGAPRDSIGVYATTFDADGEPTYHAYFSSGSDGEATGHFTLTGLAAGSYYIEFSDSTWYPQRTLEWYGRTPVNQGGTPVTVGAGATRSIEYQLTGTGSLSGGVTCERCADPLDAADVTVLLAIQDPASGAWTTVASERPEQYANYSFPFLFPGRYAVYALYDGPLPLASQSSATVVDVQLYQETKQLVYLPQKIPSVRGVSEGVNAEVTALYSDFLNRRPAPADVVFWSRSVAASGDYSLVAEGFVTSEEYRLIRIDAAYTGILGRAAEPAGRLNWLHAMQAGVLSTDDIEKSFYSSDEYFQNAANRTPIVYMQRLYVTLLNRTGAPSEWAYWADLTQRMGRAWVVEQLWGQQEVLNRRVTLLYNTYLGRDPDHDGLLIWAIRARTFGDTAMRVSFSGSQEYYNRAQTRFAER